MNINLHIDRLVLDGAFLEPHQRKELKAAVELELSQKLLNQGGISTLQLNNNKSVKGGSISIESILTPKRFGQQIGESVHRSITK